MNNYTLLIRYDGTSYAGWQIQENAVSIQQMITDAIKTILKERVNLIGSGRTDSGVHAYGQVANFKTEHELDLYKFKFQLNSILPSDISIRKMQKVDESFNSRFDAKARSYIYFFSHNKSPFYYNFSFHYPQILKIDFNHLNKISKIFLGEKDFTSFAKKHSEIEDKTCNVFEMWWRKGTELSTFYISANRFLHGMVRTIIGTLLHAAENNLDENYLLNIFNRQNREAAGESVPAKGLFLFKVRY